jgi:hypothetical protein
MQCWYFQERLHNRHEAVQVQSDDSGHYVNPARGAGETSSVARPDRDGQHQQRNATHDVRGLEPFERKKEPGDAGEHGGGQKNRCPAVETLAVRSPNRTIKPDPIPARLMITCNRVNVERDIPRTMMCVLSVEFFRGRKVKVETELSTIGEDADFLSSDCRLMCPAFCLDQYIHLIRSSIPEIETDAPIRHLRDLRRN